MISSQPAPAIPFGVIQEFIASLGIDSSNVTRMTAVRSSPRSRLAGLLKSGVKHPKQYVALRAQGLSKTRAAKIANAKRKKH